MQLWKALAFCRPQAQLNSELAPFLFLFFIWQPIVLPFGGKQADVSGFRSLVHELLCL